MSNSSDSDQTVQAVRLPFIIKSFDYNSQKYQVTERHYFNNNYILLFIKLMIRIFMLERINVIFTRLTDHHDTGLLLLRLTFGILMLFHGVAKIEHGVNWIVSILQAVGLPGFIAYGVYIGEVVAPVLIILGIFTRPAALIYALTLLVATLLVGTGKFFTLTEVGAWGLENEMLYFMGGIVIMLLGAGRYSVSTRTSMR